MPTTTTRTAPRTTHNSTTANPHPVTAELPTSAPSMTADEFAAWRQTLSVSQARAGEMLGISRVSVGKLERGAVPVDVRTALACRWLLALARWYIDPAERRSWMRAIGRWTG